MPAARDGRRRDSSRTCAPVQHGPEGSRHRNSQWLNATTVALPPSHGTASAATAVVSRRGPGCSLPGCLAVEARMGRRGKPPACDRIVRCDGMAASSWHRHSDGHRSSAVAIQWFRSRWASGREPGARADGKIGPCWAWISRLWRAADSGLRDARGFVFLNAAQDRPASWSQPTAPGPQSSTGTGRPSSSPGRDGCRGHADGELAVGLDPLGDQPAARPRAKVTQADDHRLTRVIGSSRRRVPGRASRTPGAARGCGAGWRTQHPRHPRRDPPWSQVSHRRTECRVVGDGVCSVTSSTMCRRLPARMVRSGSPAMMNSGEALRLSQADSGKASEAARAASSVTVSSSTPRPTAAASAIGSRDRNRRGSA